MAWWTDLLAARPVVPHGDWFQWHREVRAPHPLARAALTSARADRAASAFANGYQGALASMFGTEQRGALAVTETGGGHPRAMGTTLEDGRLTGTKTFVTGGQQAEAIWVVARAGELDGRPVLKVARVEQGGAGQRWTEGPTPPFVPEVPHGVLHLEDAPVAEVLEGDGYLKVVKPFRTVEDVHVAAAMLGFALGEAARHGAEPSWREAALSLLLSLDGLARHDPSDPAVHLPLAAAFDQLAPLLDRAPWSDPDRWRRDRALLQVAGAVRARRLERARAAFS